MQNPNLTHAGLTHCLSKIGLEPLGHMIFNDGQRMIDLSEITRDDIHMIGRFCNLLPDDLLSGGNLAAAI